MAKLTKKQKALQGKIDRNKAYAVAQALTLAKETATAKFDESIDVAVNLGIDARKSDQLVRGSVCCPPVPARAFASPCSPRATSRGCQGCRRRRGRFRRPGRTGQGRQPEFRRGHRHSRRHACRRRPGPDSGVPAA